MAHSQTDLQHSDTKLHDEPARLAALHRYEVLDTPTEPAFDRITSLVKTVLRVPIATVSLVDHDRQWLKSCVGGLGISTPREITFCTHTIHQREPMVVDDATTDPRFRENPLVTGAPGIRAYLGVPLSTPDGYNIGSLCAIDTAPHSFRPDEVAIMSSFAALVADELELRRLAQTDTLTGAATRRSFNLELDRAVAAFRRHGNHATLIALDIDHFKRINDTYGHPAGDAVLQAVSARLSAQLRSSDFLGRMGGEEFSILLRDTQLPEALEIAERCRAVLADSPVELDGGSLNVTASFGVAVLDETYRDRDDWCHAADRALYEAKHSGRNRCITAEQTLTAA